MNNMYPVLLVGHYTLSWMVLLAASWAIFRSFRGMLLKKQWFTTDKQAGLFFAVLIDLQVLAGLLLYLFLSPLTRPVLSNFSLAMGNPSLRFYAVEHLLVMLIALVLVHLGRNKARKAQFAARKHRISAFFYTLAVILILSRLPWDRLLKM